MSSRWDMSCLQTILPPANAKVTANEARSVLSSTKLRKTSRSESVLSMTLPTLRLLTGHALGLHQAQVQRSSDQEHLGRQEFLQGQAKQAVWWCQAQVVVVCIVLSISRCSSLFYAGKAILYMRTVASDPVLAITSAPVQQTPVTPP